MGSRIKNNPATIFDVFIEMAAPSSRPDGLAFVLWKYPEDFTDEKILKHVMEFAFPCAIADEAVQLFSFVLTNVEGKYTFGYCRHAPKSNTCLCFLSALPWSEVFYKLLNHIAAVMNASTSRGDEVEGLLVRAYHQEIPRPGDTLLVDSSLGRNKIEVICPDDSKLPRIPDNRNLTEYYNAVDEQNMIAVWASMLCERRIVFVSSKLGRLTSCVLAANLLIYPMHWQHIFIPVLPEHLFNYLHAPMPFLIGVPAASYYKAAKEIDLSEVVVLNVDSKEFHSPYNDLASLPSEVISVLKKNLKNSNHLLGDGVSRSFLRALVVLIGGYRKALQYRPGESVVTFNPDAFITSRNPSIQPFLQRMLELQIFSQFIEDRLDRLKGETGCRDEFEEECSLYTGKDESRIKYQYHGYVDKMSKDANKLIGHIHTKANPAVFQQAFMSVKSKGKDTFRDIKDKINEIKVESVTPPIAKRFPTLSGSIRKNMSGSSIRSNENSSVDESADEFFNAEENEKFGVERKRVSERYSNDFDLLREMEPVLSKQTSVLEELERRSSDSQTSNGRLTSSKSAEVLVDLDSLANGKDLFKKCSVKNSRTMNFDEDNVRPLIDFGTSRSLTPLVNLGDVVFDPLLENHSNSSPSKDDKFLSSNLKPSATSSSNVDLLLGILGPSASTNGDVRTAPTTGKWEKFD